MEPVVIARGDGPRPASPGSVGDRPIRAGNRILGLIVLAVAVAPAGRAAAQAVSSSDGAGRRDSLQDRPLAGFRCASRRPAAGRSKSAASPSGLDGSLGRTSDRGPDRRLAGSSGGPGRRGDQAIPDPRRSGSAWSPACTGSMAARPC